MKAYVREILSDYTFAKKWEYTVTGFDAAGQTADLSPTNNKNLPALEKIPIRLPNLQSVLKSGDSVIVGFVEANPAKPYIEAYPTANNYSAALAVGRQGDMVNIPVVLAAAISPAGSPIPNTYCLVIASPPPPPFVPNVGGPTSLYGVVSSGSTINKSS